MVSGVVEMRGHKAAGARNRHQRTSKAPAGDGAGVSRIMAHPPETDQAPMTATAALGVAIHGQNPRSAPAG